MVSHGFMITTKGEGCCVYTFQTDGCHADWSASGYYRATDQVGSANNRADTDMTHTYLCRMCVSDADIQLPRIGVVPIIPHSLYCCLDFTIIYSSLSFITAGYEPKPNLQAKQNLIF
jgi:hypothetical protein